MIVKRFGRDDIKPAPAERAGQEPVRLVQNDGCAALGALMLNLPPGAVHDAGGRDRYWRLRTSRRENISGSPPMPFTFTMEQAVFQ
jgi:hypothetical protein